MSFLPNLAAFHQTRDQVFVREPGERVLAGPRPVQEEACKHREYAWLAEAAYSRTPAGLKEAAEKKSAETVANEGADVILARYGWVKWEKFLKEDVVAKFKATNLRVQVWENQAKRTLVVTFGGTIFDNKMDWRANLRWFSPKRDDEYTDVVKTFGPRFIEQYKAKNLPGDYHLSATGHSLGGGLAQQFAYALPADDAVPRVAEVYAFDPSPVTGFYSVDEKTREANKMGLKIDRIYQRHEVLAIARAIMSYIYKPTAVNPEIRGVRYNLFPSLNPIAGHSMTELAQKLDSACHAGKAPPPAGL